MKQLILFFLLLSAGLSAQQAINRSNTPATNRLAERAPSTVKLPTLGTFDKTVVTDTLFPAILSEICANEPVLFFSDTTGTQGFLSGTNQFLDIEKLQRVELSESTNFTVEQVVVAFAVADDELADRKVAVNVYTELAPDGSFGDYVGTSDTLLISQLATNDTLLVFTSFPFSTPAAFTDASSFLIGVNYLDAYFDSRDSLDRSGDLAIFTTDAGCGDGENAFEVYPVTGGLEFSSISNNWNVDLELFIGAIVERDPFTSTSTFNTDFSARAFPNPVTDELTISFTAPVSGNYSAQLLTPSGQEVRSQSVNISAGSANILLSVADLSTGVYLFQVQGAKGVQTGRVIVQR